MSRTYAETIQLVRNWANRDDSALPDSIIRDGLRWAADKAYRTLRVPPLEQIRTYTMEELVAATENSQNRFSSLTSLAIPGDLIEFIQIREIDGAGRTTRIFNEKADIRTFRDLYAEKYNDFAYWARERENFLLAPGFGNVGTNFGATGVGLSDGLELYYYRRLPALDARFDVIQANFDLNLLVEDPDGVIIPDSTDTNLYIGLEVPNWLRDENERVILMGALAECFAYLQEDDQAQKYQALFYSEIQELNDEDLKRDSSGGNIQVNFNGRGLI